MDKIVKHHMGRGYLLSPELYTMARGEGELLTIPNGAVATSGILKNSVNVEEGKYSVNQVTTIYEDRLRFLGDLLKDKINPTSIDKLSPGPVEIIGLFRNSQLEDFTGRIDLVGIDEISNDEVVGVKGIFKDGRVNVQEVVHPDIPLSNKPNYTKSPLKVCLGWGKEEWQVNKAKDTQSYDLVVDRQTMITANGIRILILPPIEKKTKTLVSLLKRRHVNPTTINGEGVNFLRELPDVVFTTGPQITENYKGVTIISIPSDRVAILDLHDRQVVLEGQ